MLFRSTVSYKNTHAGAKLELPSVIWTKVRPAGTPKDFEKGVVGCVSKETHERCRIINDRTRQAIDQVASCTKRFIPIFQRNMGVSEKGKTHLNYVTMLALNGTVLLVGMWA